MLGRGSYVLFSFLDTPGFKHTLIRGLEQQSKSPSFPSKFGNFSFASWNIKLLTSLTNIYSFFILLNSLLSLIMFGQFSHRSIQSDVDASLDDPWLCCRGTPVEQWDRAKVYRNWKGATGIQSNLKLFGILLLLRTEFCTRKLRFKKLSNNQPTKP